VARTVVLEPAEYARRLADCVDRYRNQELAEAFWADFQAAAPGMTYSDDFALGFKEGFAVFLFEGGTGNPPPVPPRYYWRTEYQSVEGHQAIEDWFAGYRRGAGSARLSGYRRLVTVPPSTSLLRARTPADLPARAADVPSGPGPGESAPGEVLPEPGRVPPEPVWRPVPIPGGTPFLLVQG
jgi:hypothetical protein